MKTTKLSMKLLAILFVLFSISSISAKTIYVTTKGNGANDGLSWTSPKLTMIQALGIAQEGDQIWVKTGTYSSTIAATVPFKNISIYGGFAGTETNLSERYWSFYKTILTNTGTTTSSRLLLVGSPTVDAANCIIDGFTLQNGYSTTGGAISFSTITGATTISDITVRNCIFKNNLSTANGGAVTVTSALCSVSFYNCVFENNEATLSASAANILGKGQFYNCTFVNNKADATTGTVVYISGENTMVNCILWNNQNSDASLSKVTTSTATIVNHIAADVTVGAATNLISLNTANANIAGPNFKSPGTVVGVVADVTTLDAFDYSLLDASPCVNAGKDSVVVDSYDLANMSRIYGGKVDLGAYENQHVTISALNEFSLNNPVWISVQNKTLTVHGLTSSADLILITLDGRVVLKKTVDENGTIEIPAKGVYILNVTQGSIKCNIKVII